MLGVELPVANANGESDRINRNASDASCVWKYK